MVSRARSDLHIQLEVEMIERSMPPGGAVLNGVVWLFLMIDDYEEQICIDDVHYYKDSPLCLTQACKCAPTDASAYCPLTRRSVGCR